MKESVILTISILISNRIDTIKKCMESLRPLLEQIPSELIVVDTVGEENSDGSLEVAKEYATRVVHFDWCNDFAAARNAGLELATGEWFMFLDDDEWFENVEEIISFFISGEYLKYNSATYQIRNYRNVEGTDYSTAVLGRMLKRSENLVFVGRIHETFSEYKQPCKDLSSFVHHFGYVYLNEEEKIAHRVRNEQLLEEELKKNPQDLRYRTQMAMELATYDNERALVYCEETFVWCKGKKSENGFQWQLALVFNLYEALGKSVEETEQKYVELKGQYGFNETTETAICYQIVRICLIKEKPEVAYPYAVRYFQAVQMLYENDRLQQEQMIADSMRYQDTKSYLEMLHFGAYSAWKANQHATAWNWYECMPWEKCDFRNEEAFLFAAQLFWETGAKEPMLNIIKRIMQNRSFISKSTIRAEISMVLDELKKG